MPRKFASVPFTHKKVNVYHRNTERVSSGISSSASRSEIVVPVFDDEKVIAMLDIDSAELNTFDSVDKEWLEKVCSLLQR